MNYLYKHNKYARSKTLDNEITIFQSQSCDYLVLDEVGTTIWNLLQSPKTYSEIVSELSSLYEVEYSQLEKDIKEWLENAEKKLIVKKFIST